MGHLTHVGEKRMEFRILVRNPERKSALLRPRHRWEDDIKMDLIEIGLDSLDWIYMAHDRDELRAAGSPVINSSVP